jgi:hypothetical protein|tara:strand:+ start:3098 stop:4093 length:996 start_codon:yes stop_codon:yes gene_type:complete
LARVFSFAALARYAVWEREDSMATFSEIKRLFDEGEYVKAGEAAMKAAGKSVGELYDRGQEGGFDVGTGGVKPKAGERVIEVVTSGDVDLPVALKTAAEMLGDLELPFRDARDARGSMRARRDLDERDREIIDFMADESPTASEDDDLRKYQRELRNRDPGSLSEEETYFRDAPLKKMKQRQDDEPAIASLSQESIDELILSDLLAEGMERGAKLHANMIADFPELRAGGKFGDMHRALMGDLFENKERPLLAEDIQSKETLRFLKANPRITKAYNAAGLFKDTSKKRERSPFEGVTRPLRSELEDEGLEPGWALKEDKSISSGYRSKVAQ